MVQGQAWQDRNYKGLKSEYSKKYVPLETVRRQQSHGPKEDYKEGTSHFYNKTTSMTDYRPWPTKASFHGKKQEYRPFKARFDYNTTYKHDFDDKGDTSVAGRYNPDKNINTMRNKFDPDMVGEPLRGNSTNKEDYVDWKVTTTIAPKSPTATSNVIHEIEFTAKSLYQDDFRKWPLQRTINKKHEVERSGKRI